MRIHCINSLDLLASFFWYISLDIFLGGIHGGQDSTPRAGDFHMKPVYQLLSFHILVLYLML